MNDEKEIDASERVHHPWAWTIFFTILSLVWIYPIVLVFINSFKKKVYISKNAFSLPNKESFAGWENYTTGIERTNLIGSFGWTVFITVGAVALILLCCSMCAWWIVRVDNWAARLLYTLFLFNMIVPFQMVMFTLSKLADMLSLNTPWGLWIVYLGFGAGLAVFIFTGVVKGIPQELEESAMLDGASVPRIFFNIVVPIMRPAHHLPAVRHSLRHAGVELPLQRPQRGADAHPARHPAGAVRDGFPLRHGDDAHSLRRHGSTLCPHLPGLRQL